MVDIHSHILPGVDDGASSWAIAIDMVAAAAKDGIRHIVATPHSNAQFRYDRSAHAERLLELRERAGVPVELSEFQQAFCVSGTVIAKLSIDRSAHAERLLE